MPQRTEYSCLKPGLNRPWKCFCILGICIIVSALLLLYRSVEPFSLFPLPVLCFAAFTLLFNVSPIDINSVLIPKFIKMSNQPGLTPSRIVIYISDVMRLHGCSSSTASRKIMLAKESLNKKMFQQLTINEYCTYYGLDYLETITFLNLQK
jgi:hypothetical protein